MGNRPYIKTAVLRLWLFGAFAAEFDGEPMAPPRWRKSVWLLALLALRQGREVSREWLAETLWPEIGDRRGIAATLLSLGVRGLFSWRLR